ncbi:unnamed protein product [Ambrosiozyma monospora]|uniref:Transcription initiation factor IIA large subunit n=1 Tax=Ambrosiozyma monospora TaxID=43982 RepID=A0A9W6YZF4_AMBMO|nr:unnamed protein product [Ambrosiozyma monospora]
MSNKECADLYERIINDVIQESRQDFEDSGIDEQTLMDLRKLWRERLSKTKVATFSWDNVEEDEDDNSSDDLPLAQHHAQTMMNSQQFANLGGNGGAGSNDTSADIGGVHGLHLPQSDLALPTTATIGGDEDSKPAHGGIVLPGGSTISQSDGPIPIQEIEFEIDSRSELGQQLMKQMQTQQKKKKKLMRLIPTQSQVDGPFDDLESDEDDDQGSDLGVDSDEINSDLDDPDDDDKEDEEDNDDPETNIMLCLYDRVQRVKNKWKCNLKDGVANIEGKDYTFQKATGDSEW